MNDLVGYDKPMFSPQPVVAHEHDHQMWYFTVTFLVPKVMAEQEDEAIERLRKVLSHQPFDWTLEDVDQEDPPEIYDGMQRH